MINTAELPEMPVSAILTFYLAESAYIGSLVLKSLQANVFGITNSPDGLTSR